ncbi:MAG TPA: hypothetical protein VGH96_02490 [Streptosporangiaceae bacterium]|jgi:hypothetical protein
MARSGTALGDGLNGAGVTAADPAFSSPASRLWRFSLTKAGTG